MIKGVKLSFSINFNEEDKRNYISKVSEIQDKITEMIDKLNHNLIIGTGEPILESEVVN